MYAIVQTSGKQYRVAVGDTVLVRVRDRLGDLTQRLDLLGEAEGAQVPIERRDRLEQGARQIGHALVLASRVDPQDPGVVERREDVALTPKALELARVEADPTPVEHFDYAELLAELTARRSADD